MTEFANKKDIDVLLKEMTLEDKCLLITGGGPVTTMALKQYGIPMATFLDGGTGVNFVQLMQVCVSEINKEKGLWPELKDCTTGLESLAYVMPILIGYYNPAILTEEQKEILRVVQKKLETMKPQGASPGCFPPGILLASTWNPDVVEENGRAVGAEASAYGLDILLGTPNVNITRDVRGGRAFEGYGEDPVLTAALAPSFVKGVQKEGVLANVKHFAANNQETQRMGIDEHISKRALEEIYLPGFKACVKDGKVKSLMAAYNKVNGIHCAENAWLLKETLREEWGFDGLVMSDWGAVSDQVAAVKAGCDLVMPGPRSIEPIIKAYEDGTITMEEIDLAVKHMLLTLLEMPVMIGKKHEVIDASFSQKAAYDAAAEGIILLKNDGLLPLNKNLCVGFVGDKSEKFLESGVGSAQVVTDLSTNVVACTREKIGTENVHVGSLSEKDDVVVITISAVGQEGSDRPGIDISGEEKEQLFVALDYARENQKKSIVILNVAGPIHMMEWIDRVDAVLCVFFPGMEGGRATADILFGDLNPSGHLPVSFPKYIQDTPSYGNFPGSFDKVLYGEDIYVGYRYYDLKHMKTLFPFGHGLSYSTFEWSEARLSQSTLNMNKNEEVQVSVRIKNTGKYEGKELVQLYVAAGKGRIPKPRKELKKFCKISLLPGESKIVKMKIDKNDFESFDEAFDSWVREPGKYQIILAASAEDERISLDIMADGDDPYMHLSKNSTIKEVFDNERAVAMIKEKISQWTNEDPKNMIGTELVFFPDTKFHEVWDKGFAKKISGCSEEQKKSVYKNICDELKKI